MSFLLSRRSLLGGTAATLALGASSTARAAGVTIGIVYVGPRDDFGWTRLTKLVAAQKRT